MNIFYEPDLRRNETEILLNEQEAYHALKVLRHQVGDALRLTNGQGEFYDAEVLSITKKQCWLKVLAVEKAPDNRPYRHLIIAPLKNRNRMEWMVEKAVELGAAAFSVVYTAYAQRGKVNHQRMKRLLISAMKQSMRATLPDYQAFDSLDDCLRQQSLTNQRLIAECKTPAKPHLRSIYRPGEAADLLFGPEGDFTGAELSLTHAFGFHPVSLGDLRMRAETAPMAALAMLEALEPNPLV